MDLEAHRPVDLLPDRSAESFAKWLKEHPGVEIISRDRGKEYIGGANEGAPDAIQVADRWHLLKNFRDALKRMLETRRACRKAAADKPGQDVVKQQDVIEQQLNNKEPDRTTEEASDTIQKLTKAEKRDLERRTRRHERYETVKELYQRGLSRSEIGRRLGLNFRTVAKYIKADECPIHAGRGKRCGNLNPYMDYMTKRWDGGCHNATQIWREIRKRGFNGSRRIVSEWATKKRKSMQSSGSDLAPEKIIPWSASRASWLLAKQEEKLTEEDRQALERMKQADEKVAEAYILGQRFAGMVRERQHESLLPWLEDVAKSKISALTGFANGIKQDLAAVTNALSLL